MRLDANPYAESQGLGSPLMRPPYVDGESRPPPPMTAHMPSSTTSPTPTGVVVARACLCLQNGASVSGTARRGDVPTPLRQSPAAKDQLRLARGRSCSLVLPADSLKEPAQPPPDQRSQKSRSATARQPQHEPATATPPPRAPRRAHSRGRAEVTPNQWPPTASDDEYASPS